MSRRGWVLFAAMSLIWGIPYLLIKVAVEELSPASVVLGRTAIGAVLLLPLALARDQIRPLLPHWRPLLVFTAVEICLPWVLLGYAEQRLSSSLTGLLVAGVPLVGAVLVKATGHEPLGLRRVAGLLVGFGGVATLVGFDVETSSISAAAAVGVVAVAYATGPLILARHLAHLPSLGVVAASLAIAAAAYAPVGLAQWPATTPEGDTLLAVAGLGVICTALAFLVFFRLIAEVGPSRATVITYVNPAVALVLGALVLDEEITATTGLGFALILVGSVLATSRERAGEVAGEGVGATQGEGAVAPAPAGGPAGTLATDELAACPVAEP